MKLFNKIVLCFLGFVFVLHAFIPHLHHEQLSENQNQYFHVHVYTILDIIKLGFHEDLKITKQTDSDFVVSKRIFYPCMTGTALSFSQGEFVSFFYTFNKIFLKFFTSLLSLFHNNSLVLRGPPFVFVL